MAAAEDAGVDMSRSYGTLLGRTTEQDREDYEEFSQPDANGDNVISKAEASVLKKTKTKMEEPGICLNSPYPV